MTDNTIQENESAIGTDVVTVRAGKALFRSYLVDRPSPAQRFHAVEAVLEITLTVAQPVRKVWPIFKNFNAWMNRFGYVWDELPAENENRFVHLRNAKVPASPRNRYLVRKAVQEQLVYFDSFPYRLGANDSVFTGHNLMSVRDDHGQTEISIFMEHTWYSQTVKVDELRAEARKLMFEDAVAFWRDYFIPDLVSLIETGKVATN